MNPRVSAVEMTVDCADVSVEMIGVVRLDGTLVIDVIAFPPSGLQ